MVGYIISEVLCRLPHQRSGHWSRNEWERLTPIRLPRPADGRQCTALKASTLPLTRDCQGLEVSESSCWMMRVG